MAEGLRSKAQEIDSDSVVKDDTLAARIEKSLKEQQAFIESQFANFVGRLGQIQSEVAVCTADIKKINNECTKLHTRITKVETVTTQKYEQMEAALAQQEDRSRRDNIRIVNLPESAEGPNALAFITSSIPKWFPALASEKMEVMRAHRIGPPRQSGGSRTLICKMLRYTDRDRILKAARESPVKFGDRDIRFSADYSNYTVTRRRAISQSMDAARRQGFQAFLIYPAKLKLTRGSEHHLFETHTEVEDFLNTQKTGVD